MQTPEPERPKCTLIQPQFAQQALSLMHPAYDHLMGVFAGVAIVAFECAQMGKAN